MLTVGKQRISLIALSPACLAFGQFGKNQVGAFFREKGMLTAILNGKRRGTGLAGKQLSVSGLDGAEDVLTATVFERLSYLPEPILNEFLEELLQTKDDQIGAVQEIKFWPSDYSLNGGKIEPDVVIYGSERTVLVEAKRTDCKIQQNPAQLARELQAVIEKDEVQFPILLTIGGLKDYSLEETAKLKEDVESVLDDEKFEFDLVCKSWQEIFLTLESAILKAGSESMPGLQRMLNDVAATYEWHGIRSQGHRWLSELSPVGINTITYPVVVPISTNPILKTPTVRLNLSLADLPSPGISSSFFPTKAWSFLE
ncbi:hypothetical protein [Azonexus sp. IMCC34839]|uniref:hypothetical protein n=1 Tax=Azonexus sp. IMCC34839 TaxID=3133695 RepID=UPI00399A6DAF